MLDIPWYSFTFVGVLYFSITSTHWSHFPLSWLLKEYLTEKLQAMNCIPVFLDDAIGMFLLLSSSQSSICMHSSSIIINKHVFIKHHHQYACIIIIISSIYMHSSCIIIIIIIIIINIIVLIIIIIITIIVDLAYYGYCKKILWPLFHNVDQLDQIHAAWNLHPEDYVTVETSSGECVWSILPSSSTSSSSSS